MIEQDGLDPAKLMRAHRRGEGGFCRIPSCRSWPCLPYRLAALALDLQGKVARVEALHREHFCEACATDFGPCKTRAAIVDPTPAALCPKASPLEALTDRTCAKPDGHAGPCLFNDGRTDLEVMPK